MTKRYIKDWPDFDHEKHHYVIATEWGTADWIAYPPISEAIYRDSQYAELHRIDWRK